MSRGAQHGIDLLLGGDDLEHCQQLLELLLVDVVTAVITYKSLILVDVITY